MRPLDHSARTRPGSARACTLLAATLAATLVTPIALAQDGDGAAVGKITLLNRKAVESYHRLEFETAVGFLNEALNLSETAGLTQHPIRARTFVTLGIVTLGGFKQREQAVKYFRKALQIQPEVRLSPGLANPDIQAAFDEAIAGLANSGADDLSPDRALVHEPVRTGLAGQPVAIIVVPDKDLESSAVVLRYRAATAPSFTELPLRKGATGAFEGSIPASATAGPQVAYFIEARRSNGSVLVARGTAADPMVVSLASVTPAEAVTTSPSPARAEPRRFHFALVGGTGLGVASGTGEATRASMASSGVAWTHSGQVAPEVGYLVTDHVMIGLQARLQMVSGATPYHVPNPDPNEKECGEDHVCAPAKGAFAGLVKATWFVAAPDSAFQPYLSLSAGAGSIRHVSKVTGAQTCGGGSEPCVDTVLGGPALFGPGFGFRYRVSDVVGVVAEIGGLVGVPNFTANADLNVGVAFQL